jgi:glycerophosphoryl diester phosphodiesterase
VKKFIGYGFYTHLNTRDVFGMLELYLLQIFLFTILIGLFWYFFYKSADLFEFLSKKNSPLKNKTIKYVFVVLSLIISIYVLTVNKGVFKRNYEVLSMLSELESNFDENLHILGITNYTKPAYLQSTGGKNVIIISLESIEKGFLHESKKDLTPNLNELKSKWNFYSMKQNTGAGWTSGSLYAYMTGFPALFGAEANDIFQGAYHSEVTSLVEIFNVANYETTFLTADAQFSGTEDMLNAFNIDFVIDKSQLKEKVRDKDLFEEAKSMITNKTAKKVPFALFISTLDTHFPDGIYDDRFENILPERESNIEFMVSALDYSLGQFIDYLEQNGLLENTIVYIFPDHLKMGNPSIFNETGERELYLITNASQESLDVERTKTINQIDLPKIILSGAEVEHNAHFLSEYLSDNKNKFIEENLNLLTALNLSGFQRLDYESFEIPSLSKNYLEYSEDTNRFIAHGGGLINGFDYTNSLEALNLSYSKGFRLFELDIIKTSDGNYVAAHDWESWKRFTNYNGEVPVSLNEFMKHKIQGLFSPIGMVEINKWFLNHPNCTLITDKVNDPLDFSKKFIDKNRLMMELFTKDAVLQGQKAGILSSMPSQGVLEPMGNRKLKWLIDNNIKHVAISRRFIRSNQAFLKELKSNNIKAYAFHLNFDAGIDEDYVVRYEMDYVYGIYADKWQF